MKGLVNDKLSRLINSDDLLQKNRIEINRLFNAAKKFLDLLKLMISD